jgi:anti-sigma factor RsiW
MSHLDEGTLHALLDGELDLHEVKEIQAHIGSCAACGTRLREVKEFHGESDRLVGLLEVPAAPSRWTAVPADAEPDPVEQPRERAAPPRPPRNLPRTSGPVAEPPPLLLPDSSEYGRGRFMRRMRWAAVVLVIVGAGYLGNQMRQPGRFEFDGLPLSGATTDSGSGAVLSTEEAAPSAGADEAAPAAGNGAGPVAEKRAPTAQQKSAPAVPKRVAPRAETPAPSPAGERTRALAKTANEEPESSLAAGTSGGTGGLEDSADEAAADDAAADDAAADEVAAAEEGQPPPPERQGDVRTEAARALRELDRERQVDRAAAATAALDSARRRDAMVRQAAAPAPRTPEQRARTYLRIGLDEASKQLGRPVHVIEGMSPLFMGLALGRTSPGADATRPVVRVVYQDSQGRLILLDQQRLRPGQATTAPGPEPHWIVGEVALHLSGEVSPDILRNLRTRVR